ncbi:MAG: hypothetical protein Q7S20_08670 [Gemmatimonadaceae bacterium]|nr:hypothetical protein [Gemmatimonadaceae bacterium]
MPKVLSIRSGGYALVADRITLFYERHPTGRILTELMSREDGEITFKSQVFRTAEDAAPSSTGWASEREDDGQINTYACLENTETSAIGRALANLGFTASTFRPSSEEMAKVARAKRIRERSGIASSYKLADARRLAAEVSRLLSEAEQLGFATEMSEPIRRRLNHHRLPKPARLESWASKLRQWLESQESSQRVASHADDS